MLFIMIFLRQMAPLLACPVGRSTWKNRLGSTVFTVPSRALIAGPELDLARPLIRTMKSSCIASIVEGIC